MDLHEDEQHLQSEILKLENSGSNDFSTVCKLAELYLRIARPTKCWAKIITLTKQIKSSNVPVTKGLELVDVMTKYYKSERYSNKTSKKINFTKERQSIMTEIWDVLTILSTSIKTVDETNTSQIISLKMAYVKECLGNNQDSLSILSDLISSHAIESIDLSYVIFKAAIILKHIGQNKQSIEYLEFLVDDPPIQEGYNKVHILSFLILLYEQSGDKYKVFLPKTYKDLVVAYTQETTGEKISTQNNYKKLQDIIKSPTLNTSSEIWEILALQALEKCEYIMTVELLHQAVAKAPNKGKLQQILGEIYFLLGKRDLSLKHCEKAVTLLPQNADLRNLLLVLSPDKYAEKLRSAPVIHGAVHDDEEEEVKEQNEVSDTPHNRNTSSLHNNEEEIGEDRGGVNGWMDKMKTKGMDTIQSINDNGLAAAIIAPIVHKDTAREKQSHGTATTNKSSHAKDPKAKKPTAKKSPTKKERDLRAQELRTSPAKSATPRVIAAVEPEQMEVSTKMRKPVISEESRKMLQLVLSGNEKIHLYDSTLQVIAGMRADPMSIRHYPKKKK